MQRSFLLGLLLFASVGLTAQTDSVGYAPRKNVVKIGGSSGLFRILSLSYERVLNDEISVALTGSYLTPIKPEGLLNLETDDVVIGGDRELSGWFITPEVKWYLEHSDPRPAPRGFYMGVYMRFSNVSYTSSVTGTATSGETTGSFTSNLDIDLLEIGAGIDAGYQLLAVHDRLAIDFVFFGPRFSRYSLKVDADLHGDGELYADLEDALENFFGRDILPSDIELERKGSTTSNSTGLGYRMGFKIGYAF